MLRRQLFLAILIQFNLTLTRGSLTGVLQCSKSLHNTSVAASRNRPYEE
jgi:hypothetical protein